MSSLGRRSLSIAAAVAAVLVTPAAASAASYTVSPGAGGCGGADLACGGLAEAAAAAAAGDVFTMSPGIYSGGNFTTGGVTITGAANVLVNSTLQFSGAAGGVSKVSNVAVVQSAPTGPGVRVTGASGLELSDAIVVSAGDHGIYISEGTANKVQRAIVATGGAQTSAIRIQSGPGADKSVLLESVLTSGGAEGIGAFTTASGLSSAGDITLTMRHITAAGSSRGVVVDAGNGVFGLTGGGDIAATMTDSIAFPNVVRNQPGVLGVIAANSATLGGERNMTEGDRAAIFASPANGNYRLRPGSPAIGQGSVTEGESATDIDGEDRSTAPTDLGADEYSNAPPVAKIAVKTATPRAAQAVTFDGTGSSDREAGYGGGIVEYRWTFSDGRSAITKGPTVSHTFAKEGNAAAQLVVVDRQGAVSAPAQVGLKLVDGTPPTVAIVKPKSNQKIKQFTVSKKTKTRRRTKIVIGGLARDASGMSRVVLTLEKLGSSSRSSRCTWYSPTKGLVRKSCEKPILFSARLKKDSSTGEWTYTVKRNLSRGRYRIQAVGIDKAGVSGNAGGSKVGVLRFRLI